MKFLNVNTNDSLLVNLITECKYTKLRLPFYMNFIVESECLSINCGYSFSMIGSLNLLYEQGGKSIRYLVDLVSLFCFLCMKVKRLSRPHPCKDL